MEKSHREFATELVCPRDFLQSWDLDIYKATMLEAKNEEEIANNIASKMSVSDETVKELGEVCGRNTLFCGNEPKKIHMLQMKEVPAEVDLECVKYQMNSLQQRQLNDSCKVHISRNMKYKNLDDYMALIAQTVPAASVDPDHRVSCPNVVLTVQISKCLQHGDTTQNTIREREIFLVLGSQLLTELRDKIKCSSDSVIPGDYSCMPDADVEKLLKAGDIFKSSFFFIEDVFYNDMRLADNKDYSKPIMEWAKNVMPDKEMKTAEMSQTQFYDLRIRLGQDYLFMHQGNCEHSVLFTDMRLFSSSDQQDIRLYPVPFIRRIKRRTVCQGCQKLTARWVVRNSSLIPTDPCFLCRLCFKTFMYSKQSQKISNFQAQPYIDYL